MTNIVTEVSSWQKIRKELTTHKVGFIPTMGHLHAGHISLCEKSIAENDITVVSIFVNPTQFNRADDFQKYPRTFESDIEKLSAIKVDYVLMFHADSMYPDHYDVRVCENTLSTLLEGEFRPGHFDGVLTIVLKFFNLVQPQKAYFGEKDYQQYLLIKKMVDALFMPITVIPCMTIRAQDELALSSRNSRLSSDQRHKAGQFAQLLRREKCLSRLKEQLTSLGFKVDYLAEKWQRRLGAVWLDDIRLIDNIPVGE